MQAVVESALSSVADVSIVTTCAGRTDARVHALGQVVHFDTPVSRAPHEWVLGAEHARSDLERLFVLNKRLFVPTLAAVNIGHILV